MTLIYGQNFFVNVINFAALEEFQINSGVPIPPIRDEVSFTPLVNTAMIAAYELHPYWMYDRMNVAFSESLAHPTNIMDLTPFCMGPDSPNLYSFHKSMIWEGAKDSGHQIPTPAYIRI